MIVASDNLSFDYFKKEFNYLLKFPIHFKKILSNLVVKFRLLLVMIFLF
jgi:hypothetical protein